MVEVPGDEIAWDLKSGDIIFGSFFDGRAVDCAVVTLNS